MKTNITEYIRISKKALIKGEKKCDYGIEK